MQDFLLRTSRTKIYVNVSPAWKSFSSQNVTNFTNYHRSLSITINCKIFCRAPRVPTDTLDRIWSLRARRCASSQLQFTTVTTSSRAYTNYKQHCGMFHENEFSPFINFSLRLGSPFGAELFARNDRTTCSIRYFKDLSKNMHLSCLVVAVCRWENCFHKHWYEHHTHTHSHSGFTVFISPQNKYFVSWIRSLSKLCRSHIFQFQRKGNPCRNWHNH